MDSEPLPPAQFLFEPFRQSVIELLALVRLLRALPRLFVRICHWSRLPQAPQSDTVGTQLLAVNVETSFATFVIARFLRPLQQFSNL